MMERTFGEYTVEFKMSKHGVIVCSVEVTLKAYPDVGVPSTAHFIGAGHSAGIAAADLHSAVAACATTMLHLDADRALQESVFSLSLDLLRWSGTSDATDMGVSIFAA